VDPKVEFLFDFGSPNAYLAGKVVRQIEQRTGVKYYVPVLLGGIFKLTGNSSPADSLKGIKNKPEFMALETERFTATTLRRSSRIPFSRLSRSCSCAARLRPNSKACFSRTSGLRSKEPKQMDDPKIVHEALISSGLDADRLIARVQDQDVKNRLRELTQNAVDRGAFDCPTFFAGMEMFFGKDQLRDVEEEIRVQQAAGI
jgi:2-hydroxychromene-2-carboxylate isomerase